LPTNLDGTPILTAGNHLPFINLEEIGVLSYDSNVQTIDVGFSVTSVASSSGLANGGF